MKFFALGFILCLALAPCAKVTAAVTVGLYAPDRYDGIPKMCLIPMEVGHCIAKVKRYYFDVHRMKCTMFYWGGCAGNINNFKSLDECNKLCLDAFEVDGRVNAVSNKEPARINYISRNSSGFTNNTSGRNNTNSNFKSQKINVKENSYNNNNNYDDDN